jgi:hypothetical protein
MNIIQKMKTGHADIQLGGPAIFPSGKIRSFPSSPRGKFGFIEWRPLGDACNGMARRRGGGNVRLKQYLRN